MKFPILSIFVVKILITIGCRVMEKENEQNVYSKSTNLFPSCSNTKFKQNMPVMLAEYKKRRESVLNKEDEERLGGSIVLTKTEQAVNEILMRYKRKEFDQSIETNGDRIPFPNGIHFFNAMEYIKTSKVYQIIKLLPKGGVLHVHDFSGGPMEYAVKLIKDLPNLFMCWDDTMPPKPFGLISKLKFQFTNGFQPQEICATKWIRVSDFRRNSSSEKYMDQIFLKKLTLFTQTPLVDYPDNSAVWRAFEDVSDTAKGLLGYELAAQLYFEAMLQAFYDDNCQYVEIRSELDNFYRVDLTSLKSVLISTEDALKIFKRVRDKFSITHPDFWGIKVIRATARTNTKEEMHKKVTETIRLKKKYPKLLAGFDITGQENTGNTIKFYIKQLLKGSAQGLPYFFHAGGTDWHGTRIDDNMLTAILLNSKRIGYGTALNGRPVLAELIQKKFIGVEVSPIATQILRTTSADIRTHPTIQLLTEGFPVVITPNDPGVFGTNNLSFDWYFAFMGMAGRRADLRFLKQLAINSIKYSSMCPKEKAKSMNLWLIKWNEFLKRILIEFPIGSIIG